MSLLEVRDLSVRFSGQEQDVLVVRNASFSLEKGETFALVGESGSGKSVTAHSLMRLLAPSLVSYPSGSIRFDGEELMSAPEPVLRSLRGRRIGMVFQEPMSALNPLHTLGRQIAEIIRQHTPERSGHEIMEQVRELLALVGLPHFQERLDAYPHQLSGGERQRVVIAMASANHPDLLIADEPTTALDVSIAAQVMELIRDLQKRLGMAVLLITHDLNLVRRIAGRVAVMQRGEIVEQGDTAAVFAAPRHAYTRRLLTEVPSGSPIPMAETAETVLSCDSVRVWFPAKKNFWGRPVAWRKAVEGASLSVRRGEAVGIVGESGSGKTTLGLALLRLTPSRGTIVFAGMEMNARSIAALRPLRRRLQFVFQDPFSSLNPRMTIEDIIGEGLRVHAPELTRAQRVERIAAILGEVGMDAGFMARYPHEFSGGQRQRVSIARALILKPDLIVLDEPTSALDVSLQAQIVELLRELQRRHGVSYLFISHDLRVVRALCHRILVLKDGRIVEEGEAETLFTAPRHPYTRMLMEAAFLLPGGAPNAEPAPAGS
jgi:microcin C transport system ATP-binding protein